jgi:hypothetical protein
MAQDQRLSWSINDMAYRNGAFLSMPSALQEHGVTFFVLFYFWPSFSTQDKNHKIPFLEADGQVRNCQSPGVSWSTKRIQILQFGDLLVS